MSDDIVARLRDCDGGYGFRGIVREAADEIERLREALRIEQEELAACFIDRKATQRDRDEARREICLLREEVAFLRQTIARYQEVSVEWIRATQNRARMIEGSIE
jgi:DNA-binding transcriptional regulator YiaG